MKRQIAAAFSQCHWKQFFEPREPPFQELKIALCRQASQALRHAFRIPRAFSTIPGKLLPQIQRLQKTMKTCFCMFLLLPEKSTLDVIDQDCHQYETIHQCGNWKKDEEGFTKASLAPHDLRLSSAISSREGFAYLGRFATETPPETGCEEGREGGGIGLFVGNRVNPRWTEGVRNIGLILRRA